MRRRDRTDEKVEEQKDRVIEGKERNRNRGKKRGKYIRKERKIDRYTQM